MNLKTKLFLSFLLMAGLVGVTGLSGGYFINQVGKEGERVGVRLAPLSNAALEIQLTATEAHLIFEEIMAGDTSEDVNQVWDLLAKTQAFTDAILDGGTVENQAFLAAENPKVREKIEHVKTAVAEFIESAHVRYDQRASSQGVGSDIDQAFDAQYEGIQRELIAFGNEAMKTTADDSIHALHAVGQAKYLLADGHLILEELLSGDTEASADQVLNNFKAAKAELDNLSKTRFASRANPLVEKATQFVTLAEARIKNSTNLAAAGGKADQAFDADYAAFTSLASEAEILIRNDIAAGLGMAAAAEENAITITMAVGIISLMVAVLLAVILGRNVGRRVFDLSSAMNALVGGRLDTVVPGVGNRDEFGEMAKAVEVFKQNAIRMREMEEGADRILNSISQTTTQIGAVVTEQAAACSEQAAAVTQTSTSLEEIRQSAESAMERANNLSTVADQTLTQGEAGQRIMNNVVVAMGDIREKVGAIAHTMVVLSEQTRRVGEITESVSALAQQSKMLAINASIEAAKAGEAGKGFAVVAEEVASLAEQSEQATGQVRSVLEQIQAASEKAIFATEEGTKQVDAGVSLIESVGASMTGLLEVIEDTTEATRTVVDHIRQQNAGILQVSGAMGDINNGTNQIAVSSTQISDAMGNLSGEVEQLQKTRAG